MIGSPRDYRKAPSHQNRGPHLIADTRMRSSESAFWTLCACGFRIEAASADALSRAWDQHRHATWLGRGIASMPAGRWSNNIGISA